MGVARDRDATGRLSWLEMYSVQMVVEEGGMIEKGGGFGSRSSKRY